MFFKGCLWKARRCRQAWSLGRTQSVKPYYVPPVCAEGVAGPSPFYSTLPILDPLLLPPSLLQWTRHFCGFRCHLHVHHTSPPSPSISAFLQQHLSWHLKFNMIPVAGVIVPYHIPDLPDSHTTRLTSLTPLASYRVSEARESRVLPCLLFLHPLLPATNKSDQLCSKRATSCTQRTQNCVSRHLTHL